MFCIQIESVVLHYTSSDGIPDPEETIKYAKKKILKKVGFITELKIIKSKD